MKPGFTLLEIILVVASIAILASIVINAINPNKQLGDTRNAQRHADANTILSAAYQYSVDMGSLPAAITTTQKEICRTGASDCSGLVDLSALTNDEKYLVSMPMDPIGSSTNGTGYEIKKTDHNRVTVSAPHTEGSATITATK